MAEHVSQLARQRYSNSVKLMQDDGSPIAEYEVVCCELFSLAAATLASKLRVSLTDVGVLWDEIFATGRTRQQSDLYSHEKTNPLSSKHASKVMDSDSVMEKAEVSRLEYGRGSLMMLVQHIKSRQVVEQLEAIGYRFAELDQVIGIMRTGMHIKTPDFGLRLRHMAALPDSENTLAPGVHVGTFAIRARVDHTGFDVLVRKHARDLLPTVPLAMQYLEQHHIGYLNHLQNQTMAVVAERLQSSVSPSSDLGKFAATLLEGIQQLRSSYEDDGIFDGAVLMQHPIKIPCHGRSGESATVIMFQLVLPIHNVLAIPKCAFIPLKFFKVKQLAQGNSPYHVEFSHTVHRDMSSVLKSNAKPKIRDVFQRFRKGKNDTLPTQNTQRIKPMKRGRQSSRATLERSASQTRLSPGKLEDTTSVNAPSDCQSEYDTNVSSIHDSPSTAAVEMSALGVSSSSPKQLLGGIMVSQEIVVETAELQGDLPPYSHGRRKSGAALNSSQRSTEPVHRMDSHNPKDAPVELEVLDSRGSQGVPQRDVFSQAQHAADAFRAERDAERQDGMFVDELLSLCMRKQVII